MKTSSRRLTASYIIIMCVVAALSSCYYNGEPTSDAWDLTDRQIDSLSFYSSHHYTENYNFVVKDDSLILLSFPIQEGVADTLVVYRGDKVVVADIERMAADTIDSVWVKLARDQECQGWLREASLLTGATPDDPISIFIDIFSDHYMLLSLALVAFVVAIYSLRKLSSRNAMIVHFHDIDSPFPMTLALLVATSAVVYASIQSFSPESWRHYYYHPSLNPFTLPPHLGLLLSMVWAMIIVAIAAVDDVARHLSIGDALLYLLGLVAVCAIDYILFSVLTLQYIGYPCLLAYYYFAIRRYKLRSSFPYACGNCGAKLRSKGVCPHCGAVND